MQYLSQRLASKPASAREGKGPRSELAARQRERLLDAAELLAGERGCAATSIEALVKEAGVSTVTFYEHFEGKEECFAAAFERAVGEARERLREALGALRAFPPGPGETVEEAPFPERAHVALRELLAAIAAEPARARLCLVEAQTGGPALRRRYEAALDATARALREGRSLDTAEADLPDTLEEAIAGGLAWLLRERLEAAGEPGGEGGVEALLPKLVNVALGPYLGGEEAVRAVARLFPPGAEPPTGHG